MCIICIIGNLALIEDQVRVIIPLLMPKWKTHNTVPKIINIQIKRSVSENEIIRAPVTPLSNQTPQYKAIILW